MRLQATILLAGLALAACQTPADQPLPTFGEAVHRNMAAQIINPNPPESAELPPADGVRESLMYSRYQADKVTPPPIPSTSTIPMDMSGSR